MLRGQSFLCEENRTYCCCAAETCCTIVDFIVRQGLPGQYCDNGRRGKSMDEADDSYIKERNAKGCFSLVRDAGRKKCGLWTVLHNPTSICFPFCKLGASRCLLIAPYSRTQDSTGAAAVSVNDCRYFYEVDGGWWLSMDCHLTRQQGRRLRSVSIDLRKCIGFTSWSVLERTWRTRERREGRTDMDCTRIADSYVDRHQERTLTNLNELEMDKGILRRI